MYSMNEVVRTISEEPVIFFFSIKDNIPKTLNDVGFDLRRKGITLKVFTTDYYSIFYR